MCWSKNQKVILGIFKKFKSAEEKLEM